MGLKLHIDYSQHPQTGQDSEPFDVILNTRSGGEGAVTMVDYDIEADLAAEALGFDAYSPRLFFYQQYTAQGLAWLVENMEEELYDAFEEQGYDVFDDVSFSKEDFLHIYLLQLLEKNSGNIAEIIDILESCISAEGADLEDAREDEPGIIDRDDFIAALIEGLQKDADPEGHWSDGGNITTYLDALTKLLPEDQFTFVQGDPWVEEPDYGQKNISISYEINISNEEIIGWSLSFEMRITNPITFWYETIDWCNEDQESCPPSSAGTLMEYFGWSYTDQLSDIDGPEHPEEDPKRPVPGRVHPLGYEIRQGRPGAPSRDPHRRGPGGRGRQIRQHQLCSGGRRTLGSVVRKER